MGRYSEQNKKFFRTLASGYYRMMIDHAGTYADAFSVTLGIADVGAMW
jgi:hypothetical protein